MRVLLRMLLWTERSKGPVWVETNEQRPEWSEGEIHGTVSVGWCGPRDSMCGCLEGPSPYGNKCLPLDISDPAILMLCLHICPRVDFL